MGNGIKPTADGGTKYGDMIEDHETGDPDIEGEWVCDDPVCRGLHQTEMTVKREVTRHE
jgi:hypothetical protein